MPDLGPEKGLQLNGCMDYCTLVNPDREEADYWNAGTTNAYHSGPADWTANVVTDDVPLGYQKAMKLVCVTPDPEPAADAFVIAYTAVEGIRMAALQWGTANAVPLTMGLWMKASGGGGVVTLQIVDSSGTAVYGVNWGVDSEWSFHTAVIPPPPVGVGTFSVDSAAGLYVYINLLHQGNAELNQWLPIPDELTIVDPGSGQDTNFMSEVGQTFLFTGLILLPGAVDIMPSEAMKYRRSVDEEALLLRRHYETCAPLGTNFLTGLGFNEDSARCMQLSHPAGNCSIFVPYKSEKMVVSDESDNSWVATYDRTGVGGTLAAGLVSYYDGTWHDGGVATITPGSNGFHLRHSIAGATETAFAWYSRTTYK